MIKLNKAEQRKLFNMYKKARVAEMENLHAYYGTGNYIQPSRALLVDGVKTDLKAFIVNFEEDLIVELTEVINKMFSK